MKPYLLGPVVPLFCSLLWGCSVSADEIATSLTLPEPAFHSPVIQRTDDAPPRFELQLTREMPTPGWLCEIETVHVEQHRIYVEISEVGPKGITSQVITKTRCTIPIGKLSPGRYLVELWLRREGKGEHRPAQALVLLAR